MPARAIRKSNKKRPSATDSLGSNAEKLVSGVDRQLIELIDSDENSGRLRHHWPDAPAPCVVVVPGTKGHFKYSPDSKGWSHRVRNVRIRSLEIDRSSDWVSSMILNYHILRG